MAANSKAQRESANLGLGDPFRNVRTRKGWRIMSQREEASLEHSKNQLRLLEL